MLHSPPLPCPNQQELGEGRNKEKDIPCHDKVKVLLNHMIQVQTCDRTTTKHDGDFFLNLAGTSGVKKITIYYWSLVHLIA